jgi:hypothetical protein
MEIPTPKTGVEHRIADPDPDERLAVDTTVSKCFKIAIPIPKTGVEHRIADPVFYGPFLGGDFRRRA